MPIWLRLFVYKKMSEFYEKQNEEMKKANKGSSSSTISRPNITPATPASYK